MAQMLRVRLIGMDGEPMPEESLESLYAADLCFEPIRRRSRVGQDGTVEIEVADGPNALYAWVAVPDFGELWMGADNCGDGYRAGAGPLDFVREAATSRLATAAAQGREATVGTHVHDSEVRLGADALARDHHSTPGEIACYTGGRHRRSFLFQKSFPKEVLSEQLDTG